MSSARDYFAALAASAMDETAPTPSPEPRRARDLVKPSARSARRERSRSRRGKRADALERLTARASRGASQSGEPYRPIRRIHSRTWALVSAIVRDTSGATARSALSTLPLVIRPQARAQLAPQAGTLIGRYRVALLCGLYQLSRRTRSRRAPRVVEGFARGAVAALTRSPSTGARLSVSRVFGRSINGAPLMPWLRDAGFVACEQPGRGAVGVVRGPSGYALGLYYLADDPPAEISASSSELRGFRHATGASLIRDLIPRPPD